MRPRPIWPGKAPISLRSVENPKKVYFDSTPPTHSDASTTAKALYLRLRGAYWWCWLTELTSNLMDCHPEVDAPIGAFLPEFESNLLKFDMEMVEEGSI